MTRSGLPLAALLLVACAEAPLPAPTPPVVISPPIASASASAEQGALPGAISSLDPRLVELPDAVACALATASWTGATAKTELRVRAGGPVFARARTGKATLHLPVGNAADGAVLEIADAALAVRGHVAAEAIALHPARPFVLADAVIPLGEARLEWASAKAGAVGVTFDPHEGITLARPPVAEDVPCDALSLDDSPIDATVALPGAPKNGKEGLLRAGRPVPLSLTAGGAVIATLTAQAGIDARIMVLGAAGANTRILWTRDRSAIFGWVPTAQLEFPGKMPEGIGFGSGSGSGTLAGTHALYRVICADDVTATVELGGERWTVGRLLAGAKIFVLSEEAEGYRTVQVHGGSIEIPIDVRLMALDAQLAECPKAP